MKIWFLYLRKSVFWNVFLRILSHCWCLKHFILRRISLQLTLIFNTRVPKDSHFLNYFILDIFICTEARLNIAVFCSNENRFYKMWNESTFIEDRPMQFCFMLVPLLARFRRKAVVEESRNEAEINKDRCDYILATQADNFTMFQTWFEF